MKVIATAVGFDGKRIRQPGETFDMPDGAKGSWFKPEAESKGRGKKADSADKPEAEAD